MKLQNDISSIDLNNYDKTVNKIIVTNEKVGLYNEKELSHNNSFVRPR